MTKTSTETTLAPEVFATGSEVIDAEVLAAVEQLNWSMQYAEVSHINIVTGGESWLDGSEAPTLGLVFPASGPRVVLQFVAVVPVDCEALTAGARCFLGTGKSAVVTVRWYQYSNQANTGEDYINVADSDNLGEVAITIEPEWRGALLFEIEIEMSVGTGDGTGDMLCMFRLEETMSSLENPPDE